MPQRTSLRATLRGKEHERSQITPEILYRNRVRKTVFFMFAIVASFTVNIVLLVLFNERLVTVDGVTFVFYLFLLVLIPLAWVILPYHPRHYGINLNRLGFNLGWGFGIGLPMFGLGVLARIILYRRGDSSFAFILRFNLKDLLYPFAVAIQEIAIKGLFQSYFVAIFDGLAARRTCAILLSSVVFAQFHAVFGLPFVLLMFLFSVATGFFYEKSRSVVGVSLIHFLAGAGLLLFSNFH